MTILLMEGFDYEYSSTDAQSGVCVPNYFYASTNLTFGTAGARWGNGSGSYAILTSTNNLGGCVLPLSEIVTEGYFGCAFNVSGGGGNGVAYFGFYDVQNNITQFAVTVNCYGVVSLLQSPTVQYGNATVFQTLLAKQFSFGWNNIEIFGQPGTSGTIIVRINGDQVYSESGLNILPPNNNNITPLTNMGYVSGIIIGNTAGYQVFVDDVYFCSSAGTTNNGFLGDVRVQHSRPSANSSVSFTAPSLPTIWDTTGAIASINPSYFGFIGASQRIVQANSAPCQLTALNPLSTGKYYIEFAFDNYAVNNQVAVGLIPTNWSEPNNFWLNYGPESVYLSTYYNNLNVVTVIGSSNTSLGSVTGTSVGCMAVDLDNQLFWGRLGNGNWNANASADPATGVGGLSFSSLSAPYVIGVAFNTASYGPSITLKIAASDLSYAPPSGFGEWCLPAENWALVSESRADGDVSYNKSTSSGSVDTFTQSTTYTTGNIYGVQVVNYAAADDGNNHVLEAVISSSGTVATSTGKKLDVTYQFGKAVFETDPATGEAWTPAAASNVAFGYKEV